MTNSIGMKLALIPPGEFTMGSPPGEDGRGNDEPQHRARITKPFYLAVYEVTQQEYQRVMGSNPSYFSATGGGKSDVAGLDTSRCPVEQVSWDDAQEFCRRLSQREGLTYRLPTEAEWEYACRAGATTTYWNGPTLNTIEAHIDAQASEVFGVLAAPGKIRRTTSVGSYADNPFGLCDMHGNVWECCLDWYDEAYYQNSPVADAMGPASGSTRVVRGGGWYLTAE